MSHETFIIVYTFKTVYACVQRSSSHINKNTGCIKFQVYLFV